MKLAYFAFLALLGGFAFLILLISDREREKRAMTGFPSIGFRIPSCMRTQT